MEALNCGLLGLRAAEFLFSRSPPSIQALRVAICAGLIGSPSGGILSSPVRMTLVSRDDEVSPGSAIFPPEPPFMVLPKEERSRPPLALSGL